METCSKKSFVSQLTPSRQTVSFPFQHHSEDCQNRTSFARKGAHGELDNSGNSCAEAFVVLL